MPVNIGYRRMYGLTLPIFRYVALVALRVRLRLFRGNRRVLIGMLVPP